MANMPFFLLIAGFVHSLFRSRHQLILENLALRQQVAMLRQSVKKPRPSVADKFFWIVLSRYVDGWRKILCSLHPDTVVRWHRQGFRFYWRWKSRNSRPARPPVDAETRKLIRQMQSANVGWGAPRVDGELLKLGIEISQAQSLSIWHRSKSRPRRPGERFLKTIPMV